MTITIPNSDVFKYTWAGKAVRINARYGASTRGRKAQLYTTHEYKAFIRSMVEQFAIQHNGPPITGCVHVLLFFTLKKRSNHPDTDAYNKQVLDALEEAKVIQNDNQVQLQLTMNTGVVDPLAMNDVFTVYVLPITPGGEVRVQ